MPRADQLDALLEAASEQAGYITAAQAGRLDVDKLALHRLTRSGDMRRVRRGVYALRHAHHRLEDEIAAWLSIDRTRLPWERSGEPVAVLSHASAAALYQLGTIIPQLPALTVPPKYRSASRAQGIELHVAEVDDADWEWLRVEDALQLPVTTPARTIVDLVASAEEPTYIARAISEALTRHGMTGDELRAAAVRRKARNRALSRRVEVLLTDATS